MAAAQRRAKTFVIAGLSAKARACNYERPLLVKELAPLGRAPAQQYPPSLCRNSDGSFLTEELMEWRVAFQQF
jgi:hypothetical protein